MPEFEDELCKAQKSRLSVEEFAKKLGEFFTAQWTAAKMPKPAPAGNDMVFLVGGFDDGAPHGRVFTISVPNAPNPVEFAPKDFGATWGGQRQFVDRLLTGYDPGIPQHIYDVLNTPAAQRNPAALSAELTKKPCATDPVAVPTSARLY